MRTDFKIHQHTRKHQYDKKIIKNVYVLHEAKSNNAWQCNLIV